MFFICCAVFYIQPLTNLKKMNLNGSKHLKEFPDLSNATNLESLLLDNCRSLVEIPCSIGSLHKLECLFMANCLNLQHGPTHCNLASLKIFKLIGSRNLRKIPDLSTNITTLLVMETMLEEVPLTHLGIGLALGVSVYIAGCQLLRKFQSSSNTFMG